MATPGGDPEQQPWEYRLRKYLLLLATLVATVTYGAGFNPPGGVWQDADPAVHRIAGDPIIRDTSYRRYLTFFYANATAFALSLVVIVLVLVLAVLHEKRSTGLSALRTLRAVMVLDLLSLMVAYAAGALGDRLTATYSLVLLAAAVLYLTAFTLWAQLGSEDAPAVGDDAPERRRKVLMLLATFAVSVTYIAGLSAPGGFWDHREGIHEPGDAVLKGGPHDGHLKAFFVGNTTAFVASLLVIVLLLDRNLYFSKTVRPRQLYGLIALAIGGLVAAYAAGSSRDAETTIYVSAQVGAVLACILVEVVLVAYWQDVTESSFLRIKKQAEDIHGQVKEWLPDRIRDSCSWLTNNGKCSDGEQEKALEKARSLVLLLATLAATVTYQAGLNPPGGLRQGDGVGYKAGDPILLTANPRRYKAFYYCNSVALVASLVAIVLVRRNALHQHNALEAAMILDLFGLIGAYAAGSCRELSTSVYSMALAGAVLVYVVIHVVYFDNHRDGSTSVEAEKLLHKRRKRLLLFAIMGATITYQAGLTPPGGFILSGRRAGDSVLLGNYPRRYTAFFYCNSVTFMLSIAVVILLVNPSMYRPAIRSNALSVCMATGMMGIIGAYAAGSTQHLKTSYYIFALAAFVFSAVLFFVLAIHEEEQQFGDKKEAGAAAAAADIEANNNGASQSTAPEHKTAKRKYLMLLGILVASVTYQAGLAPPGGVWQANGGGHEAGGPVMYDNWRSRYLAFYYWNSSSFAASIFVIVLLLPRPLGNKSWWLHMMNMTIVLDLVGLLLAYVTVSSKSWKTSGYFSALVIAVLGYVAIHVLLSCFIRRGKNTALVSASQPNEQGNREPLQRAETSN